MKTAITRPADSRCLRESIDVIIECATRHGFEGDAIANIQLVSEEALVNIISYAYQNSRGLVEIYCRQEQGGSLVVEFTDSGMPFNPLEAPEPDLSAGIDERKPGGLGIFLIKSLSGKASYRREGEKNILTLTWSPGKNSRGKEIYPAS